MFVTYRAVTVFAVVSCTLGTEAKTIPPTQVHARVFNALHCFVKVYLALRVLSHGFYGAGQKVLGRYLLVFAANGSENTENMDICT